MASAHLAAALAAAGTAGTRTIGKNDLAALRLLGSGASSTSSTASRRRFSQHTRHKPGPGPGSVKIRAE